MKHAIKDASETVRQITITLNGDDLTEITQKTVARLAKNLKVAGFRPGKVPAHIAQKNLDANLLNAEVLQDAVNASLLDVLDEQKITPLDQPQVDIAKYVPGQELEFTAKLEVIPAIKLGDYKKLKAVKSKVEVKPAEIDEVIDRMARGMATKTDVTRAAKDGDEIMIDFEGTDTKGAKVAGASGTGYPLALGSNTFIPGFEEGLVGVKAGDKTELKLTFPADYQHKPLAGAKVTFAVTVHSVKEVTLPAIDDEFAAKSGQFKDVAELRADIKRELTTQKESEASDKLKDSLIEQLVAASKVPVPEVLIADQVQSIERDFVQNLLYRGLSLDQYLEQQKLSKEEWQTKELRAQATRRVQVGLVLAELSKAEDIKVSTDELNARLQDFLNYYKDPEMRKQIDTPEARRDIANRMLTEKTVDRLVELNSK